MVEGQCNCGAVSYAINKEITDVFVCHCSICRRSTGSGGIAVVIVENGKFSWTQGLDNIKKWSKPGHDWHTNFCKTCGSSLPGENDEKSMYIPVGTLASGYEKLEVKHHIFVDSKASWEAIADSGQQHSKNFEP